MKLLAFEDITEERLCWLIECVDEMFSDLDEHCTSNKKTVSGSMKKLVSEDITEERLSWLIECVDEMFMDMYENENDTY